MKDTTSFLTKFFGERIYKWQSHSPNLSRLDFFLWTYLKNIVYTDAPQSTAKLKKKTEGAIREINTTMCLMVFANLLKKASSCLVNEGGNFKHILWFKLLAIF